MKGEDLLCLKCLYEIPKTEFHIHEENLMEELFRGQVYIEMAASYYYFHKGSRFRKLIHNLKYKNRPDIGVALGKYYGSVLKSTKFAECNILIPIPLHPLKKRIRGYNQSEKIAEGISEIMDIPVDTKHLIRTVNTETQTRKTIEQRRENVESVFKITDETVFSGKHILLIDDVVTTGSTLIAAAKELSQLPDTKVSVVTLAFAGH